MQALQGDAVLGIDVSHYQGDIDFSKMQDWGVRFVYVKATEGATYQDPNYIIYAMKAKAAGLHVGLYHFARPNQSSAADEAANFIKAASVVPFDLYPVLDLEAPTGGVMAVDAMVKWVLDFEQAVTQALGKKVMLYTGKWFADQYNGFNNQLAHMPLWYSSYTQSVLPDFGGWLEWVMWQYTDSLTVGGIQGVVDANHAVSIEAIGYVPPKPVVVAPPVDPKVANAMIDRWVGHDYDKASNEDQFFRAYVADVLRVASGQAPHNATLLGNWKPQL